MTICTCCFATNTSCSACGSKGFILDGRKPNPIKNCPSTFATEANPLHSSILPELAKCPWKVAMIHILGDDHESSEAADTGSATHIAVSQWHRDKNVDTAVQKMREEAQVQFPLANLAEAATMFLLYTRDPRNKEAEVILNEYKSTFSIKASPDDQTQAPIFITGRLDQVRIDLRTGRPQVWDLKTSKKPGWEQLNMYLYQQAAYAICASKALKRVVTMGGLITPRHYKLKEAPELSPPGIFWQYAHRFEDIEQLIHGLRHIIASIRNGDVWLTPGEQCRYCPMKSTEECAPRLRSIVDPITKRVPLLTTKER